MEYKCLAVAVTFPILIRFLVVSPPNQSDDTTRCFAKRLHFSMTTLCNHVCPKCFLHVSSLMSLKWKVRKYTFFINYEFERRKGVSWKHRFVNLYGNNINDMIHHLELLTLSSGLYKYRGNRKNTHAAARNVVRRRKKHMILIPHITTQL